MTAVLVTGSTTPVGRELVRQLVLRDDISAVLAVGRESAGTVRFGIRSDKIKYDQADLRRARSIRTLLYGPARELGVSVVIHSPPHRSAIDGGRKVHALNVESTRELLYRSERHPTIERFIFRSFGDIYRVDSTQPTLIAEDHTLNLSTRAPQWLRDRVEADLTVCTRMGLSDLQIQVLRCSECLAPQIGSQLYDFVRSKVCFMPLGYDPMLNLLSVEDLVQAELAALDSAAQGVFNIPGADTLPLSEVVKKSDRTAVPVPSPFLAPLYRLRSATVGGQFRYDLNHWRFHFSGVLDGQRAKQTLGYAPRNRVQWPPPEY